MAMQPFTSKHCNNKVPQSSLSKAFAISILSMKDLFFQALKEKKCVIS
jgi:hypothetical protein